MTTMGSIPFKAVCSATLAGFMVKEGGTVVPSIPDIMDTESNRW